jgi:histidyl-tRNA synthetase
MPVGEESLNDVFQITENCRMLGYSAETPLAALKMGAMFKKAEKLGAKFALIIGEDEIAKGVAQLKNLATKEQKEIKLASLGDELDQAFAPLDKDEEGHED